MRRAVTMPLPLDPLRIALAAMMLITIGRVHQHFAFLSPLRPALLLSLGGFVYAFLNPGALTRAKITATWPARVVMGIGAMAVLSAIFGISQGGSASALVADFSKVLLLWLLLVLALRDARDLSLIVWSYLLGVAFLCWLCIFVVDTTMYYGSRAARLDSSAMHMFDPNDIGVILTMSIPLAVLQLHASRTLGKAAVCAIVAASGWSIVLGGSRGAFVGLAVVSLTLLVLMKNVSAIKRVGAVAVIAFVVVAAAPPGYWDQMNTIVNPKEDYNWASQDGRRQIWTRGVGYMMDRPLFGVGIDNFRRAEGTISPKARNRLPGEGIVFTAPHNSFVQVGAELGVPGLLLWTSLVLGGIVGMFRLHRRLPREWAQGDAEERYLFLATLYLPVSLIGFAVTASFVSFAYLDPIYILAAFLTATYVSVWEKLGIGPGARRRVRRGRRPC
ncbi:MAG: O-antigen ligase family protein [Gemmatimonadetes bacterium]|nr:O-antigen ligase family protein [Gemmatimonadota bacterium]